MADRDLPFARRARSHAPGTTLAACAAACGALLASCAGARFDGTLYRGDGFAFRISPPPGTWERIEVTSAALAFRDPVHRATVLINARCGRDAADVPLIALTNHLFFEFTDRQVKLQQTVPFDGREALHTVLEAKLDGVPLSYDVWVLKKDGCVYDLLYTASATGADAEAGLGAFRTLVRGFATVDPDAE